MPFFGGKPFKRKELVGVANNTGVFVTTHSNEAFTKFSDFSVRVQQCLSPEWTCSVCGRGSLTYQEAVECEKEAGEMLSTLQPEFGIPVLYLASRTECYELSDMVHTVYNYVKDRYFLGEIVEVNYQGFWHLGHVCDIAQIHNDEEIVSDRSDGYDSAHVFWYTIILANSENEIKLMVQATSLKRGNGLREEMVHKYLTSFTKKSKEGIWKIRQYVLKQYGLHQFSFTNVFCGYPPVFPKSDQLHRTSVVNQKLTPAPSMESASYPQTVETLLQDSYNGNIDHLHYTKRMIGLEAMISSKSTCKKRRHNKKISDVEHSQKTLIRKVPSKKLHKQERVEQSNITRDERSLPAGGKKKQSRNEVSTPTQGQKETKVPVKQQIQKILKQKNAKGKQGKLSINRKRKEIKRSPVKRECEDLKVLQLFNQLQCNISNVFFGDFMIVLEFLHSFKGVLPIMKTFFPSGVTFEVLERAVVREEVGGPFCDILQLLLLSIFTLQDEESEELHEAKLGPSNLFPREVNGGDEVDKAIRVAVSMKHCSHLSYGIPLKDLHLDAFSVSEILRLHLLMSGGLSKEKQAKWRLQYRGGYTERNDPGLLFCIEESNILNEIAFKSVSELPKREKLKLMVCLIHQILTYVSVREEIDKRAEKLHQAKLELQLKLKKLKVKKETPEVKLKKDKESRPNQEEMLSNHLNGEDIHAQQLKLEKEILRKQQGVNKKAKKLFNIAMGFRNLPLGVDCAFRRYWMFSSLPGLFVEQHASDSGSPSFKITSQKFVTSTADDAKQQVCGLNPVSNNKEVCNNEPHKNRSSSRQRILAHNKNKEKYTQPDPPVWYFCGKEEDFFSLLKHLNKKKAECQLYQTLLKDKDKIVENIQSCPISILNPACTTASNTPEVRRSVRKNPACKKQWNNFGYPPETPLPEIWYEELRNEILNIEDKLYRGGLGFLQVQDRQRWREALIHRGYDKQCDHITWSFRSETENEAGHCLENPVSNGPHTELLNVISTPYYFSQNDLSKPVVIKVLACAILQIKQCISKRYLTEVFHALDKWDTYLIKCTSFSQLYLHLITLKNNVRWSKSTLKALCRLCRRRDDPEHLLLCDGCKKGYHTYCLKPKLKAVPLGDWFCPPCEWKEEPLLAHKRKYPQESYSCKLKKLKKSDKCSACGLGGIVFPCITCHRQLHRECNSLSVRNISTRNVQCKECYLAKKVKIKKNELFI